MKKPLTLEIVRLLLNYDPETGVFTWRVRRNQHVAAGDVAGHVCASRGYRFINVCQHLVLAHRLAVFYVTGKWPENDVDHRKGKRDDNRLGELRHATRAENMVNLQGPHRDNKVGLLGVAPCNGRFAAYIRLQRKNRYLGTFDTPEEAHQAYLTAKRTAPTPQPIAA